MGDRLDAECVRGASNEATTVLVFPAALLNNRVELKEIEWSACFPDRAARDGDGDESAP